MNGVANITLPNMDQLKQCQNSQLWPVYILSILALISPFFLIFNRARCLDTHPFSRVKFMSSHFGFPRTQNNGDAGIDLPISQNVSIFPGQIQILDTGVRAAIPSDKFLLLKERSSVAMEGIYVIGGIIDSGYTGTIKLILKNSGSKSYTFQAGTYLVQAIPLDRYSHQATFENDNGDTLKKSGWSHDRGDSGFGSTDKGRPEYE